METQHVTFVATAKDGKITICTEIPVAEGTGTYLVTIAVAPQSSTQTHEHPLGHLYGALADTPLPEIAVEFPEAKTDEV